MSWPLPLSYFAIAYFVRPIYIGRFSLSKKQVNSKNLYIRKALKFRNLECHQALTWWTDPLTERGEHTNGFLDSLAGSCYPLCLCVCGLYTAILRPIVSSVVYSSISNDSMKQELPSTHVIVENMMVSVLNNCHRSQTKGWGADTVWSLTFHSTS